jgi:hypothetical protein
MKVKELIEKLQTLDPELLVFQHEFHDVLSDVMFKEEIIDVELDTSYYFLGPLHTQLPSPTSTSVKGILI